MKEYLKMSDVFCTKLQVSSSIADGFTYYGLIGGEFRFYAKFDGNKEAAKYASHAINSHDELVAEVERLRGALHDAATSLETIHIRSFGEESLLDSKPQMRSFAGARAKVAREALAE